MNDPQIWIALLVEHADALRRAGVTRIRLGDAEVDLAPRFDVAAAAAPPGTLDPLHDPTTFAGRVPGYPRQGD